MCRSSSVIPRVNHYWLVLMNVLVLQSFLAVSSECIWCISSIPVYLQSVSVCPDCINCICTVMSASLPEFITPIECEPPSHIWIAWWTIWWWALVWPTSLMRWREMDCCLLTHTVFPVWWFNCILPVLGVINKDCTQAEALPSSHMGITG